MDKNFILPKSALIAITNRCNSRCSFCNIWKVDKPIDMPISLIDKIPSSVKEFTITGGEPFLHKDIGEILEHIIRRRVRAIVITNGLIDLKRYVDVLKMGAGVRFSLDGLGAKHDEMRGIEGNFDKVIAQINYLKSAGIKDIGISSTFSDTNTDQVELIYALSRKLSVDFTCMVIGNSELYYNKSDNIILDKDRINMCLARLIDSEIISMKLKNIAKAIYIKKLIDFIRGDMKKVKCSAARSFFFLQPSGEFYACNMRDLYLGNLNNDTFEDIWMSEFADTARREAICCVKPCWTMCNAKEIMRGDKLGYFFDFLRYLIMKVIKK